jgi:hypothetical protein
MQCKLKVFSLFCAIVITCSAQRPGYVSADPYPQGTFPVKDDYFAQKITPPQKALPIDDYIIDLAKARNANFIADVTSIPKEQIVQPFPTTAMAKFYHWEPKFHLTVLDMTQQVRMSLLTYDRSTFLFWKEPDAVQLASQWVKETETDSNQKLPMAVDLYSIVTKGKNLFTYETLDDLPKDGKVVDIPLHNLPIAQKEKAIATIQQLFIRHEMFERAWFSNAFWKTAAIRLTRVPVDHKTLSVLQMMGDYHQIDIGNSLMGLQAQEKPDDKSVAGN